MTPVSSAFVGRAYSSAFVKSLVCRCLEHLQVVLSSFCVVVVSPTEQLGAATAVYSPTDSSAD